MGAAPVLTILKGGETIKNQPLEGEVVLGRAEGCVIRLDDRAISRHHAVFRPVNGGVQVEKKSEFAPISVNGSECSSALVKEGDVIAIGPYLVKLSMSAPSLAPEPVRTPALEPAAAASGPTLISESEAEPQSLILQPPTDLEEPLAAAAPELAAEPLSPIGLEAVTEEPQSQVLEASPLAEESGAQSIVLAPESLGQNAQGSNEGQSIPGLGEAGSSSPSSPTGNPASPPEFSLEIKAPEDSHPIDLGAIQVDGEGQTKLLPRGKVSAKLVLPLGVANFTELELQKDEISIGRDKDCDVALDDKKASRKHALIRRSGMNFSIKDLDSANGTYVNGSKVQEHVLSGDDVIQIGNVELKFQVLSADYERQQQNFMPIPQDIPDPVPVPPPFGGSPNLAAAQQGASAELGAIPGLAGIGGTAKKKTLFQKYRELPPRRKAIWTVIIIAALYFAFIDDDTPVVHHRGKPAIVAKGAATFESLSREQKKFVVAQHDLAFDYYRNQEYDKAIFEIDKIFALIPDYKDSREIERYAKEGKRKLEALEEEKRKEQEEEKLKLKIAELTDDAKILMDQRKYDQVADLFTQILALDPDNQMVSSWRKVVDEYEEQKRIANEQKEVQDQINARAWDLYKDGMALKAQKKYSDAIASFKRVGEIGATDKKVQWSATERIHDIEQIIADMRDPVLADAKQAEDSQEYAKAYRLYKKATVIDPSYPVGYAGMARIRGILHEQAKSLYIDAVLSESYSDFDSAKKKFEECLRVAPEDDIYHDRAQRKLASFFNPDNGSAADSGDAGDAGGADASSGSSSAIDPSATNGDSTNGPGPGGGT